MSSGRVGQAVLVFRWGRVEKIASLPPGSPDMAGVQPPAVASDGTDAGPIVRVVETLNLADPLVLSEYDPLDDWPGQRPRSV